jgi:hypothetical protein
MITRSEVAVKQVEPRYVAPPQQTRITVQQRVYHQNIGDQPTMAECQFERKLLSDDQPYQHKTKITEDWRPLGDSWIEKVSLVMVRNNEGRNLAVNPTEQEKVVTGRKVVEVGLVLPSGDVVAFLIVRPGESVPFEPVDFKLVRVRCRHGMASCNVSLFPE